MDLATLSLSAITVVAFIAVFLLSSFIKKQCLKAHLPHPKYLSFPVFCLIALSLWSPYLENLSEKFTQIREITSLIFFALVLWQVKSWIFKFIDQKIKLNHDIEGLVLLAKQIIQIIFIIVISLYAISKLGFDIKALLGGLGIGGMALAFAGKEALTNLFYYFTIQKERQIQKDQWVTVGDIEGLVEQIKLRSVSIRRFDGSLCVVPNSRFILEGFTNYSARPSRRWRSILNLSYDTVPEKLDAFCEGVKLILMKYPQVDNKSPIYVYFWSYGAHSLDIIVQCYLSSQDYSEELRSRHEINNQIYKLAARLKVDFAFPTQTIHVQNEEPKVGGKISDSEYKKEIQDFFEKEHKPESSIYKPHKV